MEPTSREDLSALMDGELAAEPTRFLLRRLDHDPELSATWSRWHLVRACLSADSARMSAPRADDDFAARIAAAIEAEQAPQVRRHWARYVGGGAIAASVAVAALMLNAPSRTDTASALIAQQRLSVPNSAAATSLAAAAPAANAATPPWLLARQPTVLGAQPASANVVYGTGLMQPDYLRRATYARDETLPFAASSQTGQPGLPFQIVLLPEPAPSSAVAAGH